MEETTKQNNMKKKKKILLHSDDSKKKERHIVTWSPEVSLLFSPLYIILINLCFFSIDD